MSKTGRTVAGGFSVSAGRNRSLVCCTWVSVMRWTKKFLKGVIVLELLGVFGAYSLFHMMNNSRDFRNTMNRRFPSILEVFYQSNEWAGVYGIRERDHEAWSAKQD
ncbi:hypothetical protein Q5P01_004597 [Channa striata]|uniref:Protein CEBPZOS n=1 Tax=Channa striata TaxID=64152 RepID=A0AA88NF58_CHASR|nr:hypothetical protein Q5P01_004597 [Channa striata]